MTLHLELLKKIYFLKFIDHQNSNSISLNTSLFFQLDGSVISVRCKKLQQNYLGYWAWPINLFSLV
uniref:Uncharacterized protein n=1 Tax=Solanum lycopersicum TaxID=4081 RepID=A0A3Q7ICT6_SOLLC